MTAEYSLRSFKYSKRKENSNHICLSHDAEYLEGSRANVQEEFDNAWRQRKLKAGYNVAKRHFRLLTVRWILYAADAMIFSL